MPDVVVTVPMGLWEDWIEEGDLPEHHLSRSPLAPGDEWAFYISPARVPKIVPGERVYIVAHRKLRGYAPLTRLHATPTAAALCRLGGAVAVTLSRPIRGFQGWRYRWWPRPSEVAFPEWRTP